MLKRVIVMNVAPSGYAVLNATDPIVAAMAAKCPGGVVFFAQDHDHPVLAAHRVQGRRTICVEGDRILVTEGSWRVQIPLQAVPITRGGTIGFQKDNVMAAIGAAWCAGLDWDTIARGLASFSNDADNAPGRFNVMDYRGATAVSYTHLTLPTICSV